MEDVHVAALIEDFRGQFKVFGEALQAQREAVQAQSEKIDGIAADVAVLKVDVRELKVDMADVKDRLVRVERAVNGKARRKTTKR